MPKISSAFATIRQFAYESNGLALNFSLNQDKEKFRIFLAMLNRAVEDLQGELETMP